MDEKQRVALNRGVPSFPVLMLISNSFLFTSVFVVVAWTRDHESFWWFTCLCRHLLYVVAISGTQSSGQ